MRRPVAALSRNHYFVIGLLLGLVLSCYIPQDIWELVQQEECPQEAAENLLIERFGQDFEPHLNLINKPLAAKKPVKNVIRPRYYSSELGIREKLFIGVMTSQEHINSFATAFNRTTAHLVNKIKFFIYADSVKTNYKLKNIVGFADTHENRRPFHVIKYIADNYLEEYDYFLLVPDNVYVDARKLNALLYHMSITFDLYMGGTRIGVDPPSNEGRPSNEGGEDLAGAAAAPVDGSSGASDRNYCSLEAGILLSSSVIRKMRNNLDRCVRIGITGDHSVNIGRCVKYASHVPGCQETFQGMRQYSYALNAPGRQRRDFSDLAKEQAFRNASTVYPVQTPEDFYRLHAYYSKHHLEMVQERGYALEQKSYRIANGSISNKILEIRWPLGVPPPSAPETRHDILIWQMLNETHSYLPNGNVEHAVAPLTRIEALDFAKVLEIAQQYAALKHPGLSYHSLHTAYRKFDATRGMDYQLHLNLQEGSGRRRRVLLKSFEVVKPLGRVEVVPSPYVTESTRIAILVPAFEHQVPDALEFVAQYERLCMQNQDNTFLLLIFLYRLDSPSKGEEDPFKGLKTLALDLSSKYKTDGSRIAWVSIRLPEQLSEPVSAEDWMLHGSMYGPRQLLSLVVADLALPKLGLESLVLLATPGMSFKADFLNRVRMNTIQGFQVYAPIGFQMYPCRWAQFCKECEACDVAQSSGYFDRHNHDVIAFYSRDYVQARKLLHPQGLPIIRSDLDIDQLLEPAPQSQSRPEGVESILDMFVAAQHSVHILRGVEPNLRFGLDVRNHLGRGGMLPEQLPELCGREQCIHLASRKQIGDAIIRYEDKSILHK
ncbi:chondroitin sulfate glucuronyltransferase [Drosophila subobscura]|uniref:chondroitin sulfate glucuronyltransferase n=1 Tax=Drosophila subobscura TaxID=7241 RepID=UPI00155A6A52|nr:chondroitin sulfate glucuronyltransferase [Drosophila subobscura]